MWGTVPRDPAEEPGRLAFSVEEAAGMLGISRDLAYDLARQRQLPTVRLGRRLVVPRAALEQMLAEAVRLAGD